MDRSNRLRWAAGAIVITASAMRLANGGGKSDPNEGDAVTAWIRTGDGADVEGVLHNESFTFTVDGKPRVVAARDLLSYQSGLPATDAESARIAQDLAAFTATDFKKWEAATEDLVDVGLPAITPLLRSYQDTDGHEPDQRYRVFGRIVPGYADGVDRTRGLLRVAGGEVLRGDIVPAEVWISQPGGKETKLSAPSIRRLAIRRASVERTFDLQSLHDCTYVSFFDTGVAVRADSHLVADAAGYVRLSFDEDGWATDPDGIKEPLPGKRKLQEGFRWGSVLGRVGVAGERFFVGKHVEKTDLGGSGHLYFVVNDNEHWQNNVGSFRVKMRATNAYDLSDG